MIIYPTGEDDDYRLFYFHGFNSNAEGDTANKLKHQYGDALTAINYDYINPDNACRQITKILSESPNTKHIYIGTSLGGFWANYFAQQNDAASVLFNPSLHPADSLKRLIGKHENYNSHEVRELTAADCEKYRKYEMPLKKSTRRTTLLGIKDEQLDYKTTQKEMEGTHVILVDQGHRIENIAPVIEAIKKFSLRKLD